MGHVRMDSPVSIRRAAVWLPLPVAIVLFLLNTGAAISGWLAPPAGYVGTLMLRAGDIALYMNWAHGFELHNLIPDYAAPWHTAPAFFNVFAWTLARLHQLTGVGIAVAYQLFHLLFYVLAAYALVFAARTFTKTATQFWAVFAVVLCTVPYTSLELLPAYILGWSDPMRGIGLFVWSSSDGFGHGISGSALVTFGTGSTLLAFTFIARYLQTDQRRYLWYAVVAAFFIAAIHVTEVFLVVGAGALALLWNRGAQWRQAVPDVLTLGVGALCGLAPYVVMGMDHQWLHDLTGLSRWQLPGPPYDILKMLGLPTTLVLVFLAMRPRHLSKTDWLLLFWFGGTLVGIFVPVVPSPQHLFDGFHYATAILLVRLASENTVFTRIRTAVPRLSAAVAVSLMILSSAAYGAYWVQNFRDGRRVRPEQLFTTVAPKDEIAVMAWLRQHAREEDLVLADASLAPWLATVPMHSFAAHWHWSLTYSTQHQLAGEFISGRMNAASARALLTDYGVRYVVVQDTSQARMYLGSATQRAHIGSLLVYELETKGMQPYPGLRQLQSAAHGSVSPRRRIARG